jgi:hypothetical protein
MVTDQQDFGLAAFIDNCARGWVFSTDQGIVMLLH